jgi:hypothetical protein
LRQVDHHLRAALGHKGCRNSARTSSADSSTGPSVLARMYPSSCESVSSIVAPKCSSVRPLILNGPAVHYIPDEEVRVQPSGAFRLKQPAKACTPTGLSPLLLFE